MANENVHTAVVGFGEGKTPLWIAERRFTCRIQRILWWFLLLLFKGKPAVKKITGKFHMKRNMKQRILSSIAKNQI